VREIIRLIAISRLSTHPQQKKAQSSFPEYVNLEPVKFDNSQDYENWDLFEPPAAPPKPVPPTSAAKGQEALSISLGFYLCFTTSYLLQSLLTTMDMKFPIFLSSQSQSVKSFLSGRNLRSGSTSFLSLSDRVAFGILVEHVNSCSFRHFICF
jgi:hypothetical protein